MPLSPEETVRTFILPSGFSATVFAAEPDVVQPIAMAIDDRGRVWIAEGRAYPTWKADGQQDRILVFEDTDGDGHFDKRTVFYEKLNYVTGLEVGFGGVFVISAPNLLFIPDKDGDGKPDGEPEVLLDGFGHQGVHNLVNGGVWGPDGWLYAGHGGSSSGLIGKPGTAEKERTFYDGGVWRYHPTKRVFESVMEGTTNPWGQDFDEFGEMFVTNSVTPHLYHVIPGSHVQRRLASPLSRFAFDVIPTIADHKHYLGDDWTKSRGGVAVAEGGGHAHSGCMVYYGGAFPSEYRGTVFMNNIHGDRVNNDVLARKGSGYTASHGKDFLTVGDPWFQGLQLKYGPDGGVYLTDWYDTGECHTLKAHRENGRVYKITYTGRKSDAPKTPHPAAGASLATLSEGQLIDLLGDENEWYVRHARRLLQEQGLSDVGARRLRAIVTDEKQLVPRRLSALWGLHVTGKVSEVELIGLMAASAEELRAWAVRLACEGRDPSEAAVGQTLELAEKDASLRVCLAVASAAQRLGDDGRWPIIERLARRDEFASDANLPLMVWYAVEPLVQKDPARALKIAAVSKLPRLREFVARRVASK
jgi:putative membrane-bound dehydrogenase-like protein